MEGGVFGEGLIYLELQVLLMPKEYLDGSLNRVNVGTSLKTSYKLQLALIKLPFRYTLVIKMI